MNLQINNLKNAVKKNQLMSPRGVEGTPRVPENNAIIFVPVQGQEEAKGSPFKQMAGNIQSQAALQINKSKQYIVKRGAAGGLKQGQLNLMSQAS